LHQDDVHGKDWPGKLNDPLLWLINMTKGCNERHTVQDKLMLVTIHFQSFATTLFALAAHSEYVQILCDEVEIMIAGEHRTKAVMGKMNTLNSFMKEAQRLYG
ncbi:hypothetical protein EV421DRAFT_1693237, partial [Armillaria borealis]